MNANKGKKNKSGSVMITKQIEKKEDIDALYLNKDKQYKNTEN